MSRSAFLDVIIDCACDLPTARAFWCAALRLPAIDPDEDGEGRYAVLSAVGPRVEVQARTDAPGFHLDLPTDDVRAEVVRLEALGATIVREHPRGWVVMRAPTGQTFCVVLRDDVDGWDSHDRLASR